MTDTQFATAVNRAWCAWGEIKDTVPDFGFREWCKRVGGFEYGAGPTVTVLHDEAKYMWFLLKWA